MRLGLVRDEASLGRFLREQISPAQEHHELPWLRFAFDAETLEERCALDAGISAWKLARESREASAQLGGRRLKALRTISSAAVLAEFDEAIRQGIELLFFAYRDFTAEPDAILVQYGFGRAHHRCLGSGFARPIALRDAAAPFGGARNREADRVESRRATTACRVHHLDIHQREARYLLERAGMLTRSPKTRPAPE